MKIIYGRFPFALVSLEDGVKTILSAPVVGSVDEHELGYELFLDTSVSGKFKVIGTNIPLDSRQVVRNGKDLIIRNGVISSV